VRSFDEVITEIEGHWKQDFSFRSSLVGLFRVGSHSHGTYIPPESPDGIDDVDFMAVVIPPKEKVLGFCKFEHCEVKQGDLDLVVYEWGKYIRLLAKSNPNVLGTLWLRLEDANVRGPMVDLCTAKSAVASRLAYPAFVGYAHGQLHRMTHHAFKGFMGLKRKGLVEKYGYDVKNAAHLIRLLRMGIEFLETGEMNVWREDAEELKSIKRGEWTLDRVKVEAEQLFARAEQAVAASSLPDHPNTAQLEQIMLDGYDEWWKKGR
jgi:predicted nucleotidyltransferase